MAKINLTDEVLRHDDPEIIEFLFEKMKQVKSLYLSAAEANQPEVLYAAGENVDLVTDVLRKLNRRNQEKGL